MDNQKGKIQVIRCKCGSIFAGCVEPYCYEEITWLKDLGHYMKHGCTIELKDSSNLTMCTCTEKMPERVDTDDSETEKEEEFESDITDFTKDELLDEIFDRVENFPYTSIVPTIKAVLGLRWWATKEQVINEINKVL